MKKFLMILALFAVIITGSLLLISCDNTEDQTEPEPPVQPTLDKSKFEILYTTNEYGAASYILDWDAYAASKFEIKFDDNEPIIFEEMRFPLGDFSADDVHTITVTAVSSQNNLKSDPVTVKFKGTKLTMPYNVRMYGDTNSFGWKESDETQVYVVSCEELDLDIHTSKPIGTGKIKTTPVYNNRLPISDLRLIYSKLDLYALESFRVQALPYNGNVTSFEYKNENDVIELQLPSDFSEQSVNFYAGTMSNPSNVRWDFDDFEEHPSYAYIKWDGAISNYKYKVMTKYPEGYFSRRYTENGANQINFGFDYTHTDGEYEVTVQAECDDFDFIGESKEEKWVTYMFNLQNPVEETLKFKTHQTVLDAPKNVRVEGENLVWDEVEFAGGYSVLLKNDTDSVGSESVSTAQKSLKKLIEYARVEGEYEVEIYVSPSSNICTGIENNVPQIQIYLGEDYGISNLKVKLESISKVQNVNVDYENKTITWDANPEAVSYTVSYKYENGGGCGTIIGLNTQYTLDEDDLQKSSAIIITAECEFTMKTENDVITLSIPSEYIIDLTKETEN